MSEAIRDKAKQGRPQFRNIHVTQIVKYRLPASGKVSIMHRISGFGIFLLLPFLLYLFQQSVLSEDTFNFFKGILEKPLAKLIILGALWAYFAHFCAGVRHLIMDTHMALEKNKAHATATAVLVISTVLTIVAGLKLFGVF
jgi:succinate dehydrogenase / fumarate reductase, cytochrome b subunit